MTFPRRSAAPLLFAAALIGAWPATASAQKATRIQLDVDAWWPTTEIHTAGEAGGVPGTPIDFNSDFGLTNRAFPQMRVGVRPAARHEISVSYIPIRYNATARLSRDVTFGGTVYPAGVQTHGAVSWDAWRIGYAYDLIRKPRVSLAIAAEVDRTNVQVRLQNANSTTSSSASVPTVPTAGAIVRIQANPRLTLSAEASGIYVPDRKDQVYGGHLLNAATRATWSLGGHTGIDLGFRLIDIRHLGHADSGTMKLRGLTLGVTVWR